VTADKILIYCDGACSGNQFNDNVGGWGAILKYGNRGKKIFGGEKNTTNQRMELTACIKALEQLKSKNIDVEIYSDSAYLVDCMNDKWYEKWRSNGWRNSKKQPVENKDLWQKLLFLIEQYKVSFHKVDAHSGVHLNEIADELAQLGINTIA
jgi:ribonuclease HI